MGRYGRAELRSLSRTTLPVRGCAKHTLCGPRAEAGGRALRVPEALLLGTGTSNGVPMLGTVYPDGYLDNPKNHRNRSCLVLKGPTGNFLLDCAPEMRL